MIYAFVVEPDAQEDAWEAASYLELRSPGEGLRFLNELERCYRYIRDFPHGFQERRGRFRHAMLDVFPYRVVYEVDGGTIHVYQIRHASREPSKRFGP
ncbi:MAG: type II toxin-antitoxin system RelE/ParE family toxin [Flavobacteriales bacterium]|nr:type II toxin-antitoxin system RelE/ParE family toxin [Flavobacteriales bacterium]